MENLNILSKKIIGLAIEVHRNLGSGLLESTYSKCLCYELEKHNIAYVKEKNVNIIYKQLLIENAYRADLIIDDKIIIEIKAIENLMPVHKAQLLTYLKLQKKKLGLLLNFNVPLMKDGIVRLIN